MMTVSIGHNLVVGEIADYLFIDTAARHSKYAKLSYQERVDMTLYDLGTVHVNSRRIDRAEDDILHGIEQCSYTHSIRSTQRNTCTSYLSTTATTTCSLFVV